MIYYSLACSLFPAFPRSPRRQDLAGLLRRLLPPPCCLHAPTMGYCHLLENQGGLPEKLIPVPGSNLRPLNLGGWAVSWGSPQRKWHLQGPWRNKLHPPWLWVNPKATVVLQWRQDYQAEQGHDAVGRLSFIYRSFQVIPLDIQDYFFLPGVN